jgi:outer membrane immunogenic protein
MDWFGTVRGRAGFLPAPTWLIYGTGGLAYGHVSSASDVSFTSTTDVYNGSASTTRTGWTAGGGAEWMFASHWTAKFEYLYVDLGTLSYADACITAVCTAFTPPPAYQTDLHLRDNIIRAGVNYKF